MITIMARPRGAGGVDVFAEADEADVQTSEFVQTSRKRFTKRAIRSNAQTITMSNRPRRASAVSLSSPGRLAFVPLIVSVYSPTIS